MALISSLSLLLPSPPKKEGRYQFILPRKVNGLVSRLVSWPRFEPMTSQPSVAVWGRQHKIFGVHQLFVHLGFRVTVKICNFNWKRTRDDWSKSTSWSRLFKSSLWNTGAEIIGSDMYEAIVNWVTEHSPINTFTTRTIRDCFAYRHNLFSESDLFNFTEEIDDQIQTKNTWPQHVIYAKGLLVPLKAKLHRFWFQLNFTLW